MRQLLTGIEKIIRGLRTLNRAFLSGTNPSSVTQVVLEMQAKQVEFQAYIMEKMTILLQTTAYNMAIIGWKWKNYNRSENGKQIAFIQDQSQLCTSIRS